MFRGLLYIIATIFVITFIRAVVGLIGKAVAQLFEPQTPQTSRKGPAHAPNAELVQDPVCGIYVSTETKLRKKAGDRTYYFCSESCMNKFKG
jgi:YHS domain-containing protein